MKFGRKDDAGKEKRKFLGFLRCSQLITTFGPGSIVDMPNYSIIIGATDYWSKSNAPTLREPNLERILRVSYFKQPETGEDRNGVYSFNILSFRFPQIHYCSECGRMSSVRKNDNKCPKCKDGYLIPSRFVAACVNGHLEDFPYKWWVHQNTTINCPSKPGIDSLAIEFNSNTGGLDSIIVSCSECGAIRSMEGCFAQNALKGHKCHGQRPWIGLDRDSNDPCECNAQPRALQRGASNVYFGVTASALTIPPWSNKIRAEILKKHDTVEPLIDPSSGLSNETLKNLFSKYFKDLLNIGKCSVEEIISEAREALSEKADYSEQKLREDEYDALSKGCSDESGQFKALETPVPPFLAGHFSKVVLVSRLREVLALKGFRRIHPDDPDPEDIRFSGYYQEKGYTELSREPLDWLPAIEMLGEGIFIQLDVNKLSLWKQDNATRYREMEMRANLYPTFSRKFLPEYVLLHTLSHLLIRQLVATCGYSGASIKERVYCTQAGSEKQMAGILLYTSSSDSDGSLGGLVRNGKADRLEEIIHGMLHDASWCSSDPICAESKAQGVNSMNYAACHACTLLPETSCESGNIFLDRVAVSGGIKRESGFMSDLYLR